MTRWWPLFVDVALVVAFATVGRSSHSESLTAAGIFATAWPFVAACLAGWVTLTLRNNPGLHWSAGVFLWLLTLAGGMALRVAAGGTTAVAFIIVAGAFLALGLIGWRLVHAWQISLRKSVSVRSQS